MGTPKKYGLIIPKKNEKLKDLPRRRAAVFEEEDSDDAVSSIAESTKTDATKFRLKKQNQLQIERALSQDASVYEYDSIYESISSKTQEKKVKLKEIDRKPRYIGQLLKASAAKKLEDERRVQRGVQRERKMEAGIYDDKEAFVTDAYRQKMVEMKEEEEKEERRNQIEDALDVRKQRDLSGFYRHLLNRTAPPVNDKVTVKIENNPSEQEETKAEATEEAETSAPIATPPCERDTQEEHVDVDTSKTLSESRRKRRSEERGKSEEESSNNRDEQSDRFRAKHAKQNIGEKAESAKSRYLARRNARNIAVINDDD